MSKAELYFNKQEADRILRDNEKKQAEARLQARQDEDEKTKNSRKIQADHYRSEQGVEAPPRMCAAQIFFLRTNNKRVKP